MWRPNANDSPDTQEVQVSSPRRVTEARVAQLEQTLSPREVALVQTLDRLRLASTKQLERLHFTAGTELANARQVRRTLARLVELRVLTRLERRVGGPKSGSSDYPYVLDVAG